MSLMKQVVHAQCPNCKNTLRIPATWIGEAMKCKHCGTVFQAQAPKTPKKKKPNIVGRAIRAATTLHVRRKRKKKNKDRSKPTMPRVGAPMAQAVVPVAKPVAGGAPVAIPIPAGAVRPGAAPVAVPVGLARGQKPDSRPRSRGSWQKIAFVLVFFLGVGSLALIVHQANNSSGDTGKKQVAAASTTSATTAGRPTTAANMTTAAPKTTPAPTKRTETTKPTPNTSAFVKKTNPATEKKETPRTQKDTRRRPPPPTDTETKRPPVESPVYPLAMKPEDSAYKSWPRRMLAISVNNYLYQNPVNFGRTSQSFDAAVYSLSQALKVPNDQVTMLSDRLPQFAPPTKAILQEAISRFLAESRPADHVVLLFAGHGIEVDGVPYLVPLMGDKDDVNGLISLDWLYARLAGSPAQQKLLILDVARYDPKKGEEFGKTESMSGQFAALAQKPPRGVQVLTSCAAGQYSYEMESEQSKVYTGIFQNAIVELKGKLLGVEQQIDGPIPADVLKTSLNRRLVGSLKFFEVTKLAKAGKKEKEEEPAKYEQTPQLSGTLFVKTVGPDGKGERKKLTVKRESDPIFKDGIASRDEIANVLELQRQIPPLKKGDNSNFYLELPFAKKSLAAFEGKNGTETDLREFVRKAVAVLKETDGAFVQSQPPLPDNQQAKTQEVRRVEDRQKNLAETVYAKLEGSLAELKSVADLREKEPPLWKANYDYVMARILFRMVHTFEYQFNLGKIRKDDMPAFDKERHREFVLVPKVDLSDREEKPMADEAKKVLQRLAKDAKGTPWEVIAKREMNTSLGMQWVAR